MYELPEGVVLVRSRDAKQTRSVLRFESSDVCLDLVDYPKDWEGLSDDELVGLLRRATTPAFLPEKFYPGSDNRH